MGKSCLHYKNEYIPIMELRLITIINTLLIGVAHNYNYPGRTLQGRVIGRVCVTLNFYASYEICTAVCFHVL